MAVAISRWMTDLQPVAKRYLGSEIARIDTMSSYSCRNAYGRRSTRLSEHGKANALDIRGFMTQNGVASNVLDDWGMTGRDIQAQVAAANAAAKKAEAVRAAATLRGTQPANGLAATASDVIQPNGSAPSSTATGSGQKSVAGVNPIDTTSTQSLKVPSVSAGPRGSTGIRIGTPEPSPQDRSLGLSTSPMASPLGRLGGPMPRFDARLSENASTPKATTPTTDGRAKFHRTAHETACKIFGTVLGPEANEAHRNHFHIDLAERRLNNFCE